MSLETQVIVEYGKAAGILSFGIKGGSEAGTKFIDALELITRLVNIGDGLRYVARHS